MKYAACEKCSRSVGMVNVLGNILMIALKGYLGVVGGSKGLIAEAIHSCTDLLATIVMILGLRISAKEANERYPYGYGKAEYLVAACIYLFLLVIGCYIIYEGVFVIMAGHWTVPCLTAAWGAIFSIGINELMFRQSLCVGAQINSPAMIAKAWESRSDVYSSLGVLIGIVGSKFGLHFMDPLAATLVGVLIVKICVEYLNEAFLNLMDKAPGDTVLKDIRKRVGAIGGIADVKDIYARELGKSLELEVELSVPGGTTVDEGEMIKRETRRVVTDHLGRNADVHVRLYPVANI